MSNEISYRDSGVDIDLGNEASKIFYGAAKQTWENRKGRLGEIIVPYDDFSGLRFIDVSELPKGSCMGLGFDGVGTKVEVAERRRNHNNVAYDLFTMVCDDAVVRGAEPVLVGSILDINSLGRDGEFYISEIMQLGEGYINAAREADVAVINGEVAELGAKIKGYGKFINYNWGAGVVWFASRERLLSGYDVSEGDILVGFREEGLRSNGLSLTRKILEKNFGEDWHNKTCGGDNLGELVAIPSRIYTRAVVDMFGGWNLDRQPKAKIKGVAHITGGGIPEKLGRALKPSGLGALIDDSFIPGKIINYCQRLGNVSDEEAYKIWNMGLGMIIITREPYKVMQVAADYNINSKVIGRVVSKSGIRIKSCGIYSYGKFLDFD